MAGLLRPRGDELAVENTARAADVVLSQCYDLEIAVSLAASTVASTSDHLALHLPPASLSHSKPLHSPNMIISRLLSIGLRIAQFVFAAIVLGLTVDFLYERTRYSVGPSGRTIFSII
ncbi:hypothetical protein P153DRAFT_433058 [Dothidotthia symphoricarpi CBS 119687]|uniref:Uncharacterized protein n=1 Tax=Dothidotthia symphoricarpi CBS 119687 TaxID=1392245 RepID=A0A6A6A9B7_9PLEO|nr:uncharacterized protein P153DRAFT_433058 [Dothidotthia symphoricarpi CBS 119687]KAF2127251.1 hypothetical protein P153DRAFT_433058 [Dothidotthia symphoricarpi CBS 119687]